MTVIARPPQGDRLGQCPLDVESDDGGVPIFLDGRKDHGELVAAQPAHRVAVAGCLFEQLGDIFEQFVAGVVAEGVVDVFEAVQIQHQQRHDFAIPPGSAQHLVQAVGEQLAIGQAGHRIVARMEQELLFGFDLGRDVDDQAVPMNLFAGSAAGPGHGAQPSHLVAVAIDPPIAEIDRGHLIGRAVVGQTVGLPIFRMGDFEDQARIGAKIIGLVAAELLDPAIEHRKAEAAVRVARTPKYDARHVEHERAQRRLAVLQRLLALSEQGDVGEYGDHATVQGAMFADQDPAPIGQALLERLARIAVAFEPLRDDGMAGPVVGDPAPAHLGPTQCFERGARTQQIGDLGKKLLAALVTHDQAILGIIKAHALRQALHGLEKLEFGDAVAGIRGRRGNRDHRAPMGQRIQPNAQIAIVRAAQRPGQHMARLRRLDEIVGPDRAADMAQQGSDRGSLAGPAPVQLEKAQKSLIAGGQLQGRAEHSDPRSAVFRFFWLMPCLWSDRPLLGVHTVLRP